MDPLADKILMIGTLSSLLFLEVIQLWPFLIIVGRDVVITFYRNYLIAKNKQKIRISDDFNSIIIDYSENNKEQTAQDLITLINKKLFV